VRGNGWLLYAFSPKKALISSDLCNKIKVYTVGEVPERPKGADCKSVGNAFGGSNPPLSIVDVYLLQRQAIIQIIGGILFWAGIAQLEEHQPSKLRVAGSSPVSRSKAAVSAIVRVPI
jgi:hypothetical protein